MNPTWFILKHTLKNVLLKVGGEIHVTRGNNPLQGHMDLDFQKGMWAQRGRKLTSW